MIKPNVTILVVLATILLSLALSEETLPVLSKYPVASVVGSGDIACGQCYRLQPVGECDFPPDTTPHVTFKVIDLCEGGACVVQGSEKVSGDLRFVIDEVHIRDWISACTLYQIEYQRVPCSQWNGFSDSTLFFPTKCPLIPADDHLLPSSPLQFSFKRHTDQSCDSSSNCQVCNNGQCSQCFSGYYKLQSNLNQCFSCALLEGCMSCQDFKGCDQCTDAYLLVSNSTLSYCSQLGCKQSSYYCLLCHYNGCDQCISNYFKMNLNEPCIPCSNITGCNNICNDYFGCSQCRSGYVDAIQDGMHICSLTRSKCDCSSPPSNPQCPFTFTAQCVPTTKPPQNAATLDPNDCSLWQWNTTCDIACGPTSCSGPKPDPGSCKNTVYACTPSLTGGCAWDFTCNDIKTLCTPSSCNCGNSVSPLINCQGGVPPNCNCSLTSEGTCIAAYQCPPPAIQCTADPCYNCLNASTSSSNCNSIKDINICTAACTTYSSCLYQANGMCEWSNTTQYQQCLAKCSSPPISTSTSPTVQPSSTPNSPTSKNSPSDGVALLPWLWSLVVILLLLA